ncbi:NAD(P)/FAD-dependent oxidoreductase [uncultured Tateyamaria sp.]|uniref:flavin monoamine oxidase family protein n=1 Tax=uncultured Tateyamaria sp. TaxID=455651 RepID=UPI00262D7FC0|nr:NAD(P)/FAD-dependent oxidoreductase [uncultured Tateyamaria sp.]
MQTLIIGGGLSGLALAEQLEAQGHDYMLVEARERFGGRIKTETLGTGYFDMGPAWFWPGQPRIAALIDRLKLEKFDQFSDGILSFEDEQQNVQRGRGFASMEGSWRLKGGLAHLTQTLADRLPDAHKRLNAAVTSLSRTSGEITATFADGTTLTAGTVVLALPPRVAAEITFEPALPAGTIRAMQGIATWMAGQAKAIAVYDRPFWRETGLSGDAMSRFGPMAEVHDASPAEGGPYALFGFIGVPPQNRRDEQALRHQVLAQFARLFGEEAANPNKLFIKDWAFDPYTSTDADKKPLYAHPSYGLPGAMIDLWDGQLRFAGTEVAPQFGGYIEGALEAADNVARTIGNTTKDRAHAS